MWTVPLKNSWAFPVIEAAHLFGVALLAGTILLADLRTLGWAVARQTGDELDKVFAVGPQRARDPSGNGRINVVRRLGTVPHESRVRRKDGSSGPGGDHIFCPEKA